MELSYSNNFKQKIIFSVSIMLSAISVIFTIFFIYLKNLMLVSFSFTLLILSLFSLVLLYWGLIKYAGGVQVLSLLVITFSTVWFDSVGGIEDIFKIGVIGLFIFLLSLLVFDSYNIPLFTISCLIVGVVLYFFFVYGNNSLLSMKDFQALLSVEFPLMLSLTLGLLLKKYFSQVNYYFKKERDRAITLSKNRTKFLANISNEIRTPLNGILDIVYLLESTNLDKNQKELIRSLNRNGHNLRIILDDILHYSQIEKNGITLHESQFSFNLLIDDIKKTIEPLIGNKDLKIEIEVDESLPEYLIGDAGRIKQIMANLIGSSIKYTNKGSVYLEVKLESRHKSIVHVNINIKDTGEGIPSDQIENSISGDSNGVGLGLSIAKKLIDKMGGHITVDSEIGTGTEFNIILPLKEFQIFHGNKDVKILVVDDNHTNLLIATTIIKKIGYSVETALNGRDALEFLSKDNYDIVFMDIHMPELDGIEVTEIIRENKGGLYKKDQIVVALTATESKRVKKRYKEWSMDDYLLKPIDPYKLKDIVEKWIKE